MDVSFTEGGQSTMSNERALTPSTPDPAQVMAEAIDNNFMIEQQDGTSRFLDAQELEQVVTIALHALRTAGYSVVPLDIETVESTWTDAEGQEVPDTQWVIHGVRCIDEHGLDVTVRPEEDE